MQILNAHTESLGWIDRETILLKQKVEDVRKIADSRKKEREHTFRSVSWENDLYSTTCSRNQLAVSEWGTVEPM